MITEDYVSFEIAKLLKEKGFDEDCLKYYIEGRKYIRDLSDEDWPHRLKNSKANENVVTVPTLQMAMKWLREVHNLHIITIPYAPIDRPPYHPGEADIVYIAQLFRGIIPIDEVGRSIIKLTHEQTCEAAIKYCLEHLI